MHAGGISDGGRRLRAIPKNRPGWSCQTADEAVWRRSRPGQAQRNLGRRSGLFVETIRIVRFGEADEPEGLLGDKGE